MTKNKVAFGLFVIVAIATVALAGCANGIPKGTLSYYLPKAETTFTVTQTLTCTAGNTLLQIVTVNPSTVYSSDTGRSETVTPNSISGAISDADISFCFTDDGRLNGVNTATAGQGGSIVKDVLAVAKAAGAVAAASGETNSKKACDTIAAFAPKSTKPDAPAPTLTLTYTRTFGYDMATGQAVRKDTASREAGLEWEFDTDFASHTFYRELQSSIPLLGFDFSFGPTTKAAAPRWDGGDSELTLKLNSLAVVSLQIRSLKGDMTGTSREPIWAGDVLVPMTRRQDLIEIPIPKAAFFGQRKFSLALAGSGAITKIGYVSTGVTEAADALGSIGGALGASTKAPTVAQQAAALQAQADLIFQQQRLANCKAKPESCSGK